MLFTKRITLSCFLFLSLLQVKAQIKDSTKVPVRLQVVCYDKYSKHFVLRIINSNPIEIKIPKNYIACIFDKGEANIKAEIIYSGKEKNLFKTISVHIDTDPSIFNETISLSSFESYLAEVSIHEFNLETRGAYKARFSFKKSFYSVNLEGQSQWFYFKVN
jgi:hypothetical protein